jgi:hypothetical protein
LVREHAIIREAQKLGEISKAKVLFADPSGSAFNDPLARNE